MLYGPSTHFEVLYGPKGGAGVIFLTLELRDGTDGSEQRLGPCRCKEKRTGRTSQPRSGARLGGGGVA